MAFARPSLQDLIDHAVADLSSRLPGADAGLRRSNLNVLARVISGGIYGLYGYLDWQAKQILPDTADSDILDRWASIWGVTRQPATFSTGQAQFTGTSGSVVPAGTVVQRADGSEFATSADATLSNGAALATVTALAGGAAGNTVAGTALSLISPIASVDGQATVQTGGLINGADAEVDDSLRARLLLRIQQPPQGGAANDYVEWALQVPGVTRAWPYPGWLGAGTVGVTFTMDSTPGGPIPDAGTVAAVQAFINSNSKRPVTAAVTVFAPTPVPLNLTIQATPNTAAVQASIQAELTDLLTREAVPGGTILLSHINEAISLAAGESDHVLVAPSANVTVAANQMSVMGTITWQ